MVDIFDTDYFDKTEILNVDGYNKNKIVNDNDYVVDYDYNVSNKENNSKIIINIFLKLHNFFKKVLIPNNNKFDCVFGKTHNNKTKSII